MEFLKLYDEENKDILYSMSWLNKNSNFDKSIGNFKEIDLFTFLENISKFNYERDIFYDDIYYILEYTEDSVLHLINNINKEIKREHKIIPISQAKEFDKKTILWLSRQGGRTLKEKLKNNKIKAVKRYRNVDTYENRIFKIFLKKLLLIEEKRKDIQSNNYLINKIRQWLRSDDARSINEYGNIVYNNILLHHPHYSKIFKSYKWLNRLDEKVQLYKELYPKQIIDILTFDILAKLQFKTKVLVLADTLAINYNNFKVEFNENCLPENINLYKNVTNLKVDTIEEVNFKNITKLEKDIFDKQLYIECNQDKIFNIKQKYDVEVFIDLFRLFPIAKIDTEIINFPITLQQYIDGRIVNANNTKVINLNYEIYTLPEILKTYDTKILRVFLENFEKYFKDKQLNYIIPDYVNIFEFSQVKKTINNYFSNPRSIPKSILAGLEYLLEGKLQENDTLVYIQKNHDNDLYVTPLLVKYDKKLQNMTNGLYLEKHPTKKIQEESDSIDDLNRDFKDKTLSKKLLSKFLQNGIKGIKKEQISFYLNEDIIHLENSNNFSKLKNRTTQIKSLFTNKTLFTKEYIEIEDTNEKNLNNFEKLLQFEKDGFILWREHLPKLSMQIVKNGYFDEFILVDDDSEVKNGNIEISNHFVIPPNVNYLSFPLTFDEENINFKAYISSSDLPLKSEVICELKLTYNYENETPYELIFISLDNSIKPLKVSWREIQYIECNDLPIPEYPPKRKWEDFLRDPKPDGNGYSNLLEWLDERLSLLDINKAPDYMIEKETNEAINSIQTGSFVFGKFDSAGKYFCFIDVNGEDVFCHSSNFIEDINTDQLSKGDQVFLKVVSNRKNPNKKNGQLVSFTGINKELIVKHIKNKLKFRHEEKSINEKTDNIFKAIKSVQYPLRTVWNNHSLVDEGTPNEFRKKMFIYLDLALQLMANKDVSLKLKNELLFFFSALHQDMPKVVSDTLVTFSLDLEKHNKYTLNIALSLGNCELKWQKNILNNIIKQLDNTLLHDNIMEIFAIASWRSERFILAFQVVDTLKILDILITTLEHNYKLFNNSNKRRTFINIIVKQLELLLALIRLRKINQNILCPQDILTQRYINILDSITKYCVENDIIISTRLKIKLTKEDNFKNIPDLLHALRIYLTGDTTSANSLKIIGISDE